MIIDPDYPQIVMSFDYRGFTVQLDESTWQGQTIYAAWVNHEYGCAIAVPYAPTRRQAIQRSKTWVDRRLAS